MDESFSLFKEKNTQSVAIHETFLVLRFLSFGLAFIITISLFVYVRLVIRDGPLFIFKPSEK